MRPTDDEGIAVSARRLLRRASLVGLGLLLAAGIGQPVTAQEQDEHHEFHHHHVAVVAGGMTPLSETSETSFAVGADYTYSFNARWGAGIGADFTFGDHKRSSLLAGGVHYNLPVGLKIGTGPGVEFVEKEQADGGSKNSSYFVWWIGAAYEFRVGALSIGPILFLDFVGETKTNLTYGVTVGTGF